MAELIASDKIAEDAIHEAENYIDRYLEGGKESSKSMAWFALAYAALRILANIADTLEKADR